MREHCPHCGASLAGMYDAYCTECRGSLTDDVEEDGVDPSPTTNGVPDISQGTRPFGNFTFPARLVILLGVLGSTGGTTAYIVLSWDHLPAGSYPIWFFAFPIVLAIVFLCAGVFALFRWCGIPIYGPDPNDQANKNVIDD